jgi:type IV fimbrial biogenesis protein FimT
MLPAIDSGGEMPDFHSDRPQPRGMRARHAGGFTLVELAITLVVLAVLIGMASPLFTRLINGNRLTGNANEMITAMQIARSEAVRRNARTFFCHSSDGTSCSAAPAGGWDGWLVFADEDTDNVVDPAEIVRSGIIEDPIQLIASPSVTNSRIVFRPDGLAYAGNDLLEANMRVCLPVTNPNLNVRDVNIAVGGRIAVRAPIDAGGACAAPGNL